MDAYTINKFLVYFYPFSIEIVSSEGTINAGITNPIPDPNEYVIVRIEVTITLYFSENQQPLILAGALVMKGVPAPPKIPETKQIQNPVILTKILINAAINTRSIPVRIAI